MRSRRWVGPLVALALVVGLVAGCGGSGPPTTDSSDGGNSSGGGNSGGGNSSGGGGGSGGDGGSGGSFAWVPYGPNDPDIPTPSWPAYNPFADGRCSELQDYLSTDEGNVGEFGKAMAAVCFAAVEGRQDQWDVAAKAFAAADASSLANDCLAGLVTALVKRALAWHRDHPGRKPTVRFQRGADKTDCGKQAPPTETEPTTTEPTTTEPTTTEPTTTEPTTTEPTTETTG